MARRLIVDTGVLIQSERGLRSLVDVVEPDDDIVIAPDDVDLPAAK